MGNWVVRRGDGIIDRYREKRVGGYGGFVFLLYGIK